MSIKASFTSNIFIILVLNLIVKPVYVFGIDAKVQNIVGEESFGTYFDILSFCFLFQVILDMGIQNYNSTLIAKDKSKFKTSFDSLIGIKLLLAILFVLICYLSASIFSYNPYELSILIWVILQLILLSFYSFIRGNIAALGFYRVDTYFSVLDKCLLIFGLGLILWFSDYVHHFQIFHFVIAQSVSLLVSIGIAIIFLISKNLRLGIKFNYSSAISLFKKSLPFAFVLLLMQIYTRMDGVMLGRLLEDAGRQAGIYAAGYRIIELLNMLGFLFATLLLPMYANHIKKRKKLQELSDLAFRILLVLVTLCCVSCLFYAEDIMRLIYTNGDNYYAHVFRVLICCFYCISLSYIYGSMITASGNLKNLNLIYGIGVLINIVLNYKLIPSYFAIGAAYSTLITQLFVFLSLTTIAHLFFKLKVKYRLVLKYLIFVLSSVLLFYVAQEYVNIWWGLLLIFSAIFCLFMSFLMGILGFKLIDVIKTK